MLKLVVPCLFLILFNFNSELPLSNNLLATYNSTESVKITAMDVFDEGAYSNESAGNPQVDIIRDACLGDPTDASDDTTEPFYETVVGAEVLNNTHTNINFSRVWFKFPRVDGTRRSFSSRKMAPITVGEVKPGERKKIFAFLLMTSGSDKVIPGKSSDQGLSQGFRGITVYLKGRASNGEKYQIRAKTTISFKNYDRCLS